MDSLFDVVALGELLIDFTPAGEGTNGNYLFECNPGGAPANVLGCLSKLGKNTAFIGKVGADHFGLFLEQVLVKEGVSTEGLVKDTENNTTLAFVHLEENGERSFSFYRKSGADINLRSEEVDKQLLNTSIFHFGSLSLTHEPARSTTIAAVKHAKGKGALISYDPNLRASLWSDLSEARRQILALMGEVEVVKVSGEELRFLTGIADIKVGSKKLFLDYNLSMLLVTVGEEGCYYRFGDNFGKVAGFKVKTIDTTGAGDAFLGGMLYQILERKKTLCSWTIEEIVESTRFANAVGALVTTKKGAFSSMPELKEVKHLLSIGV